MKKLDAAYIAGIMDGEGCFRLERFKAARSPIGYQYRTIAEVMMCDRPVIEHIAAITAKNISRRNLPSGRVAYGLTWRNGIAADLIRSILPFLRGKHEQARLCLHFEDHITPGRGRTYRPDDLPKCEEIRLRVQELKRVVPFAAD